MHYQPLQRKEFRCDCFDRTKQTRQPWGVPSYPPAKTTEREMRSHFLWRSRKLADCSVQTKGLDFWEQSCPKAWPGRKSQNACSVIRISIKLYLNTICAPGLILLTSWTVSLPWVTSHKPEIEIAGMEAKVADTCRLDANVKDPINPYMVILELLARACH